ncbi:MAG: hypothetical protein WDW38_009973 [Sanguina aurantia]
MLINWCDSVLTAEANTWLEGISCRASLVTIPVIPASRCKVLIRGDDLLLALAGQLSAQGMAAQPASAAGSSGKANRHAGAASAASGAAALPRSLSMISWLPACRSLRSPPLQWLRAFFCDLRPQQRHVGVDDRESPAFKQVKLQAAATLVQEGSQPSCRNFARFGVPQAMRAAVWEGALGEEGRHQPLGVNQPVMLAFSRDSSIAGACSVLPHPLLVVHNNVVSVTPSLEAAAAAAQSAPNNQQLQSHGPSTAPPTHPAASTPRLQACAPYAVLNHSTTAAGNAATHNRITPNCDSHSSSLHHHPAPAQPALSAFKVDLSTADGGAGFVEGQASRPIPAPFPVLFPPSGVVPFQGQVLHAAPLCYLYSSPAALYRMYRAMYCRYWCGLHSLSPSHGALPMLCKVTEDVLQVLDPTVVTHLQSLLVPPASLVMPWLTSAFVGFLPVAEVLLLWDRVVGLDSLLPLPLLAVAVLCFRRQVILACRCADELREVMSDLSKLQTVALLQAVLFEG